MTMEQKKLLAVALLLGLSLFQIRQIVLKNLPNIKGGADVGGLKPVMDSALLAVQNAANKVGGVGVITSGLDTSPKRLPNSLHRKGLAIDARRADWPNFDNQANAVAQRNSIEDELGAAFDVVLESDHVHIEFDPPQGLV